MAATLASWRRLGSFAPADGRGWMDAVRGVANDPRRYAFRCNREVVDVADRFRCFAWRGQRYVLKEAASVDAAGRERELAARASARLTAVGAALRAVVPELVVLDAGESWLASPYLGPTLHEAFLERRLRWEAVDVLLLLAELRKAGLEWAGFAPRNLIVGDHGTFGIDWEDLHLDGPQSTDWSDLTLFKLALNWAGVFGSADGAHAAFVGLQRKWRSAPLDGFEKSWCGLRGGRDDDAAARRACSAISFESEQPAANQRPDLFSPQEAGHLVSDLLGSPLDVFYAAAAARWRRNERGDDRFLAFLRGTTRSVDAALRLSHGCRQSRPEDTVRRTMARAVGQLAGLWSRGRLGDLAEASRRLRRLRGRRGLAAALLRARLTEYVIATLWRSTRDLFGWDADLQLLLRGSVANGMCSIKSDVDFEISSPARPDGFAEAEMLLKLLLDGFGIPSEPSAGRPSESDIVYPAGTRDVLEWLELRDLDGSSAPWPHAHGGRTRSEIALLGTYERGVRRMDGKHLWLAVRGAIARASALHGCRTAKTLAQVGWLRRVAGADAVALRALLKHALDAYERDLSDAAVEPLQREAVRLDVPVPLWTAGVPAQ